MRKHLGVSLALTILTGCTGFQAEVAQKIDKSSNPWSQGIVADSSSNTPTTPSGVHNATCAISVPALIMQNQELRVLISTQGIASVQVSVNGVILEPSTEHWFGRATHLNLEIII